MLARVWDTVGGLDEPHNTAVWKSWWVPVAQSNCGYKGSEDTGKALRRRDMAWTDRERRRIMTMRGTLVVLKTVNVMG